jgi:hypothetical protein
MELSIEFWIGISLGVFLFVMLVIVLPWNIGMKSFVLALFGLKSLEHGEHQQKERFINN